MRTSKRESDLYNIGDKIIYTPKGNNENNNSYIATVVGYWYSHSKHCWVEYECSGEVIKEAAMIHEIKIANTIRHSSVSLPTI